ncbi:MAG: hypothetical protein QW057_00980 [Candidatus Bathyarchaeia archaeon]
MPAKGYAVITVREEVHERLKQQADSKGLTIPALLEELALHYSKTYSNGDQGGLTTAEVEELIAEAVGRLREQLREELKAAMEALQESLKAYVDERLDAAWNS